MGGNGEISGRRRVLYACPLLPPYRITFPLPLLTPIAHLLCENESVWQNDVGDKKRRGKKMGKTDCHRGHEMMRTIEMGWDVWRQRWNSGQKGQDNRTATQGRIQSERTNQLLTMAHGGSMISEGSCFGGGMRGIKGGMMIGFKQDTDNYRIFGM